MKRTDALKEIVKVLKKWEGCEPDMSIADKVMLVIEKEIGMSPPEWTEEVFETLDNERLPFPTYVPRKGWEPVGIKKRRSMREISESIRQLNSRRIK